MPKLSSVRLGPGVDAGCAWLLPADDLRWTQRSYVAVLLWAEGGVRRAMEAEAEAGEIAGRDREEASETRQEVARERSIDILRIKIHWRDRVTLLTYMPRLWRAGVVGVGKIASVLHVPSCHACTPCN